MGLGVQGEGLELKGRKCCWLKKVEGGSFGVCSYYMVKIEIVVILNSFGTK